MKKIKNIVYVMIGLLSLMLGIIGIVIPVLPTTPFLLLSSFCFAKGSDKFDRWFKGTKIYKRHLESFVRERALPLRKKVFIVLFADAMILIPFILIDSIHLRIFLIVLVLYKLYYFTFKIKTI